MHVFCYYCICDKDLVHLHRGLHIAYRVSNVCSKTAVNCFVDLSWQRFKINFSVSVITLNDTLLL